MPYGLTVLVVTWNRPTEIRRTLDALVENIQFAGPIEWRVADAGSDPGYLPALQKEYNSLDLQFTTGPRAGWGANVNRALRQCQHPCVFLCEDDYVATRSLDLNAGVALLMEVPELGVVRYDGLDGHKLVLQLHEANLSVGRRGFLVLDAAQSPGDFVYSNRPHLKHIRFHHYYGPYATNKKLGETEDEYTGRVKRYPNGPRVTCLLDGLERAFEHIGQSWQAQGY